MRTIKELRIERGLRLADIAVRIDVDPHTVWYWEHGRQPSARNLLALARLFNVSADSIELGAGYPRKRKPSHDASETR